MLIDNKQRVIWFWGFSVTTVLAGLIYVYSLQYNATLDILPIILKTRDYVKPLRSCATFAEDYSKNASSAELIYHPNSTFTFKYTKSAKQQHAFAGVWFPLENLSINFSEYDAIVVDIKASTKTKRIPLNFTVQNKIKTYQYIRHFIELEQGKTTYTLKFENFFTPTSWYERNKITQVNLPEPDFSKINTMSLESCGILGPNIEDKYTITQLRLIKNVGLQYAITFGLIVICIGGYWVFCFGIPFKKEEPLPVIVEEKEIIHIPIKTVEYDYEEKIEDKILEYLSKNYTNPNLNLSDLTKEFGKNSREISSMIKETTKMSFPKYISFLRIEEAKRILKSDKYQKISEVGYIVGFNSPSNFNRVFKEKEGVSPKQFTQNN